MTIADTLVHKRLLQQTRGAAVVSQVMDGACLLPYAPTLENNTARQEQEEATTTENRPPLAPPHGRCSPAQSLSFLRTPSSRLRSSFPFSTFMYMSMMQ